MLDLIHHAVSVQTGMKKYRKQVAQIAHQWRQLHVRREAQEEWQKKWRIARLLERHLIVKSHNMYSSIYLGLSYEDAHQARKVWYG